ncbi:MAG: hypothetical protein ACTSSF_11070 [Candidatus Heimdallarchaeaceae archaeon]
MSNSDFSQYMEQAKKDVERSLEILQLIFEEHFSEKIDFAYVKGSSIKKWESLIDYVPIVSDVDVHLKTHSGEILNKHSKSSLKELLDITQLYEDLFLEDNELYLHIPRIQIVNLSSLLKDDTFVWSKVKDVRVLIGQPPEYENLPEEEIRKNERNSLLAHKEFLVALPEKIIDKTGLDLWNVIRQLSWRVSSSPIRLLNQISSPYTADLWKLNRTQIVKRLKENNLINISELFQDFYYEGWITFLEEFQNSRSMRRMILLGYEILEECLHQLKSIEEKPKG